jgi:hypothetical protein
MAEIKIRMDKAAIILSAIVRSLGLLSAILGFVAEGGKHYCKHHYLYRLWHDLVELFVVAVVAWLCVHMHETAYILLDHMYLPLTCL